MLKDKIILITGASSGIGTACANYFANVGAKLWLCARRIDVFKEIAIELKQEYGVEVYIFKLDVRKPALVKAALKALPEKWQKVDVLVNNEGLAAGLETIQEGNIHDWDDMIDTNVKACFM